MGACASPTVVEKQKVTDHKLSCAELESEMRETERFRAAAEREKGFTGTNAAAVVFFWPALFATYSNVGDATRAAEERKSHLMDIYRSKQCNARMVEAGTPNKVG